MRGLIFLIFSPIMILCAMLNALVFKLFWCNFSFNEDFQSLIGAEHMPERFMNPSFHAVWCWMFALSIVYTFFSPGWLTAALGAYNSYNSKK